MHMTVAQILEATGSRLVTGDRAAWVDGCSIDTRTIQKGDLFVAFPGERVDGNDFVPAAIEAGAACVAMTREPSEEVVAQAEAAGCAIVMQWQPDSERFLLSLASFWREQNSTWIVVGVTGSVGKTTTKEMLAAAIGTMYPVHATSGNYNSLIGVALTVLAAGPEHRVLVLEMGMNHAGELFRQTRAVRPHLAVITNIGTSHIGNLGSREGIARAKAEILSGIENTPFVMGGGRRLYLRGEEDFFDLIEQQARYNSVDVVPCGPGAGNEVANYAYYRSVFGDPETLLQRDENPEVLARKLKAAGAKIPEIYMCCGTEDFLIENNRELHRFFESEGIVHEYHEGKGVHDMVFWHEYIAKIVEWMFGQ